MFGMYPRSLAGNSVDVNDTPWLELPFYYHMVANALIGKQSFRRMPTSKVIEILSSMSPTQ